MIKKIQLFILCIFSLNSYALDKGLEVTNEDIILGDKNAKITVIEYSSLTCPHCASFHQESFDEIYKNYINTNKVRWVYRPYTSDKNALNGALLIDCAPEDQKKKYISILLNKQSSWAFSKNSTEILENLAKIGGMSGKKFNECIDDKKRQEKFLKILSVASNDLLVKGTPAFFINGERRGLFTYQQFKEEFEKLSK